ncbi:RNA polymerase sigma factor [Yinghuangia sp. YIM S09857]|uniref:RNA polymerase sigma factor n=1 Tax=Yinghuangia sp. YIM S09857 TaxID=3436929 RepID=UPI003F537C24
MTPVREAVADAHRREWAILLAATVRVTRDLDLAEECVQDAYAAALEAWARDGVPGRPGAWLTVAARHNAVDALRRARTLETKLPLLVEGENDPRHPDAPGGTDPLDADTRPTPRALLDDRLRLVFLCCHPALPREGQVALTLRLVCGVPTADIARMLLVPEATLAARITRAKKKLRTERAPFRLPGPTELTERLDIVLTVVHLLSTAGHAAPSGPDLLADEPAGRALDLARMLHQSLPRVPETSGLLALVLAHHARRGTRTASDGRPLTLAEQDRSRWDRAAVAEAEGLVENALRAGTADRFTLQAAIATLHAGARTYEDTDWPQILALYDALLAVWPTPVVALNRAVAVAHVDGPLPALAEVARLERDGRLATYHYLPAVKADLLRRTGDTEAAAKACETAIALTANAAERKFLQARLAELRGARGDA